MGNTQIYQGFNYTLYLINLLYFPFFTKENVHIFICLMFKIRFFHFIVKLEIFVFKMGAKLNLFCPYFHSKIMSNAIAFMVFKMLYRRMHGLDLAILFI